MSETVPISRSFGSVDHLEEVTRSLGWLTEYRQLNPGTCSSKVISREGGSWFILGEQHSRAIEAQGGAPTGMYVLALVEGEPGVMNGQSLRSNHIFLLGPEAEFRTILPRGLDVIQVGLAMEQFEDIAQAVAPNLAISRKDVGLIATVPGRLTGLRRTMKEALTLPAIGEAAISRIVAEIVAIGADHSSARVERNLHSAAGRRALDRAREYIEAHIGETIRVASICRYADTTLRSLERVFARELGMSPQQYVKVRRLNAVHHCLMTADAEQDFRVTDIALRHGFTHLGRFAGEYRRYFGESPRETLQHPKQHGASTRFLRLQELPSQPPPS